MPTARARGPRIPGCERGLAQRARQDSNLRLLPPEASSARDPERPRPRFRSGLTPCPSSLPPAPFRHVWAGLWQRRRQLPIRRVRATPEPNAVPQREKPAWPPLRAVLLRHTSRGICGLMATRSATSAHLVLPPSATRSQHARAFMGTRHSDRRWRCFRFRPRPTPHNADLRAGGVRLGAERRPQTSSGERTVLGRCPSAGQQEVSDRPG